MIGQLIEIEDVVKIERLECMSGYRSGITKSISEQDLSCALLQFNISSTIVVVY